MSEGVDPQHLVFQANEVIRDPKSDPTTNLLTLRSGQGVASPSHDPLIIRQIGVDLPADSPDWYEIREITESELRSAGCSELPKQSRLISFRGKLRSWNIPNPKNGILKCLSNGWPVFCWATNKIANTDDGLLMWHCKETPWSDGSWTFPCAPIDLKKRHLERWFEIAIDWAGKGVEKELTGGIPSGRTCLNAAFLILKRLGLDAPFQRPMEQKDSRYYQDALRNFQDFIEQQLYRNSNDSPPKISTSANILKPPSEATSRDQISARIHPDQDPEFPRLLQDAKAVSDLTELGKRAEAVHRYLRRRIERREIAVSEIMDNPTHRLCKALYDTVGRLQPQWLNEITSPTGFHELKTVDKLYLDLPKVIEMSTVNPSEADITRIVCGDPVADLNQLREVCHRNSLLLEIMALNSSSYDVQSESRRLVPEVWGVMRDAVRHGLKAVPPIMPTLITGIGDAISAIDLAYAWGCDQSPSNGPNPDAPICVGETSGEVRASHGDGTWEGETPKTQLQPSNPTEFTAPQKKKITKDEANVLVREWLKVHAHDTVKPTRDRISAELKISTGAVSNTPAWKAYQQKRKPARLKEIPLSEKMLAKIPNAGSELDVLLRAIKELSTEEHYDKCRQAIETCERPIELAEQILQSLQESEEED